LIVALASACRGNPTTVLTRLEDSRRLVADLRVQLSHATDASNGAVMAESDEAATAFAQNSEEAKKALEAKVSALARLLEGLNFSSELQMLREFEARFAEYKQLDSRVLELAVENTNLKARALSFGLGSQAADAFCRSLDSIAMGSLDADRCRVDRLVSEAVLAVREIQVLHGPHIAERDESAMARMEKQMTDLDAKARAALDSLRQLLPTAGSASADALTKLDQFKAVSNQIVQLSRRNSNVISLDLSLREKPRLKAACDERLQALQAALEEEGPKSKR
jgi:hypothetical protein